jgi:hypothetical protein
MKYIIGSFCASHCDICIKNESRVNEFEVCQHIVTILLCKQTHRKYNNNNNNNNNKLS